MRRAWVLPRAGHGRRLVDHQLRLQRAAGTAPAQHGDEREAVDRVARREQQRRGKGGERAAARAHHADHGELRR